jgi:hypothetical protein
MESLKDKIILTRKKVAAVVTYSHNPATWEAETKGCQVCVSDTLSQKQNTKPRWLGHGSRTQSASMCKALGSIPSTEKKKTVVAVKSSMLWQSILLKVYGNTLLTHLRSQRPSLRVRRNSQITKVDTPYV